jgi:hypothetical protein
VFTLLLILEEDGDESGGRGRAFKDTFPPAAKRCSLFLLGRSSLLTLTRPSVHAGGDITRSRCMSSARYTDTEPDCDPTASRLGVEARHVPL